MRLNDFSRLIGIGEITKDVGIQISDPPIVFCAAEENAELKLRSAPRARAPRCWSRLLVYSEGKKGETTCRHPGLAPAGWPRMWSSRRLKPAEMFLEVQEPKYRDRLKNGP